MDPVNLSCQFPAEAASELAAMGALGSNEVRSVGEFIYGAPVTHAKICPLDGSFENMDFQRLTNAINLLVYEMKRIVGAKRPVTAVHPNVYGRNPPLREFLLTEPATGVTLPIWEFDLSSGKRLMTALTWGIR